MPSLFSTSVNIQPSVQLPQNKQTIRAIFDSSYMGPLYLISKSPKLSPQLFNPTTLLAVIWNMAISSLTGRGIYVSICASSI